MHRFRKLIIGNRSLFNNNKPQCIRSFSHTSGSSSSDEVLLKVLLPNDVAGVLIGGNNGRNIKQLMEDANVWIQVSQFGEMYPNTQMRTTNVEGSPADLKIAIWSILDKCERVYLRKHTPPSSPIEENELVFQFDLSLPQSFIPHLESAKKPNWSEIAYSNDKLPPIYKNERLVSLTGSVSRNLETVSDIVTKMQLHQCIYENRNTFYDFTTRRRRVVFDVPNQQVGIVLGKNGSFIEYVRKTSGARIIISAFVKSKSMRTMTMTGTTEEISLAEEMISDKLAEVESARYGDDEYCDDE